jgi:hypothetical protein
LNHEEHEGHEGGNSRLGAQPFVLHALKSKIGVLPESGKRMKSGRLGLWNVKPAFLHALHVLHGKIVLNFF